MGPLKGIRVVEICEGICGPLAASRLGDAGADVIKVEDKEGDAARRFGPPFLNGQAAVFLAVNRNKRSVQLDLTSNRDQGNLRELLASADVVLEDRGAVGMAEMGLPYAILQAEYPSLIVCTITAFGEAGPLAGRPGAELVIQCAADVTNTLGTPGDEPVRLGVDTAAVNTAIFASQGVLGAIYHRARGGPAQHVHVDMTGSVLHTRGILRAARSISDEWEAVRLGQGSVLLGYEDPPDEAYRAKNGRVYFILRHVTQETFDNLMLRLGLVEYILDPRFGRHGRDAAPPLGVGPHMASARPVWESAFGTRTVADITSLMQEAGADVVPFNDVADALAHPQVNVIGSVISMEHPSYGSYRDIRPVWRFSATPVVAKRAAPLLGEHTAEVLDEILALRSGGPSGSGPA
jgi:formyl-CoA transferase